MTHVAYDSHCSNDHCDIGRFHSYYADRMVLQSGAKSNIWGYTATDTLTAQYKCLYVAHN